jgi:hypothetical protein
MNCCWSVGLHGTRTCWGCWSSWGTVRRSSRGPGRQPLKETLRLPLLPIFVRFRWRWHLDTVCFLQLVRASLQGDPKPDQGVFQRLPVATTFSPLAGLKACLPGYRQRSNLREKLETSFMHLSNRLKGLGIFGQPLKVALQVYSDSLDRLQGADWVLLIEVTLKCPVGPHPRTRYELAH